MMHHAILEPRLLKIANEVVIGPVALLQLKTPK
jgi:hypothetical protein